MWVLYLRCFFFFLGGGYYRHTSYILWFILNVLYVFPLVTEFQSSHSLLQNVIFNFLDVHERTAEFLVGRCLRLRLLVDFIPGSIPFHSWL